MQLAMELKPSINKGLNYKKLEFQVRTLNYFIGFCVGEISRAQAKGSADDAPLEAGSCGGGPRDRPLPRRQLTGWGDGGANPHGSGTPAPAHSREHCTFLQVEEIETVMNNNNDETVILLSKLP